MRRPEHLARISSAFRDGQTTAEILAQWAVGRVWCHVGKHWYAGYQTRPCHSCKKKTVGSKA